MEEGAGKIGRGWEGSQRWGTRAPVHSDKLSHLLRDSPGTLYELLLSVGVAGAALQGACLGNQSGTAMPQLLHTVLDVGTYLWADGKGRGALQKALRDLHCAWRSHEGPSRTCIVD